MTEQYEQASSQKPSESVQASEEGTNEAVRTSIAKRAADAELPPALNFVAQRPEQPPAAPRTIDEAQPSPEVNSGDDN